MIDDYPGMCLKGLKIVGVPAEIRIQLHPNMSLERYRYTCSRFFTLWSLELRYIVVLKGEEHAISPSFDVEVKSELQAVFSFETRVTNH
jgi:hypothetical protein